MIQNAKEHAITFQGDARFAEYFYSLVFLNESTDGYFFLWDYEKERVYFASAIEENYALHRGIGEGYTLEECTRMIYRRDLTQWAAQLWNVHEREQDLSYMAFRMVDRDGRPHWMSCRGRILRDKVEKPLIMVGYLTGADVQQKADSLTGLMGSSRFLEELGADLAARKSGTILVLGLDNFKDYNKKYGRSKGNDVLVRMARVLDKYVDEAYRIYRLDSDRFALNLTDCHQEETSHIYQSIRKKMQNVCSISGGSVAYPVDGVKDAGSLYLYAESALDRAKKEGKDRLAFFSPEDYKRQLYLIDLTEEMRESVKNGCKGFSLRFQPQVRMSDYHLSGAEALLRYESKRFGLVSPEEFITILEQTGLIIPVGAWVLKEAIAQCKKWRAYQNDFHMSINLSYTQLKERELSSYIYELLDEQDLPGAAITLELTESMQLQEYTSFNQLFYDWSSRGIEVSIDDFGTGYSSLSYLKSLAIDEIKIDRCFVSHIQLSSYNYRLLNNILELAKSAKIRVCCEGVETLDELHILEDLAPGILQGYYFSKPLTMEEFEMTYLKSPAKQESWEKELLHRDVEKQPQIREVDYKTILDELEEVVYVMDLETYELYYMNPATKRLTGNKDYAGEKCYSLLYGRSQPCPFCSNKKLLQEKNHVFHSNNTYLGKRMLIRDKVIQWNGRPARLEIGFNASNLNEQFNVVDQKLEVEENLVRMLRSVFRIEEEKMALQELLHGVGRFYKADHCMLFLYAKEIHAWRLLYEWNKECIPGRQRELFAIPEEKIEAWHDIFAEGKGVEISGFSDTELLEWLGARAVLMTAVRLVDKPIGILITDNPTYQSKNPQMLVKAAPFVAGLMEKSGILEEQDDYFMGLRRRLNVAQTVKEMRMGLWEIVTDAAISDAKLLADRQAYDMMGLKHGMEGEEDFAFWWSQIKEGYQNHVKEALLEMMHSDRVVQCEYIWKHPKQGETWMCMMGACSQVEQGKYVLRGCQMRCADIVSKQMSENKKLQNTHLRRDFFYEALLQETKGYAEVRLEDGKVYASGGLWENMEMDCQAEKITYYDWFIRKISRVVVEEDQEACFRFLQTQQLRLAYESGGRMLSLQYRRLLDNLTYHWMEAEVRIIKEKETGNLYALFYLKDIDAVKQQEQKVACAQAEEPINLNRRMFEYQVVQHMREEAVAGTEKVMLLIDLDAETEAAYRPFLHILWRQFRKSDRIGRLGEHQFAVFVDAQIDREKLHCRLTRMLEEVMALGDVRACHIGVVFVCSEEFNYERVVRHAAEAMQESKREGGESGIGYYRTE